MSNFIKGMDLSTLLELERLGARYYDGGIKTEILELMKRYDVDTIRVRLFHDPYSKDGKPYGAGGNDLETALEISGRATEAGLGVLLNFQYSDFWADPGKQIKPKAWASYSVTELEEAVFEYTRDVLKAFTEAGIRLKMAQVGNELTNGLLWPEGKIPDYDNIARFVNAGIRGVRAVYKELPVMLHLDNGGNNELYRRWFDEFMKRGEEFQIIGLSYYPFWHGSMKMLEENMRDIACRYHKDLIVVETSMGYTMEDYGEYEGLSGDQRKGYATKPHLVEKIDYPMTKEGQADFIKDLLDTISRVPDGRGKGFFWWEPAWIPIAGSGWATVSSLEYMNDPGPCGNEWANQALFDYDGNALPAWKVIRDFVTVHSVHSNLQKSI
ncbi:MAG: glycosyl hydrolase 53 family protein [Lachnospiraceae bacterium]